MALVPFFNGSFVEYRDEGDERGADHPSPVVMQGEDIAARFDPIPGVDPRIRPIRAEELLGPPTSAAVETVQQPVTGGAHGGHPQNPDNDWSLPGGDKRWVERPAPQQGFRKR